MKEEWRAFKLDQLGFVGRGKSRHRPRNDPRLYGGQYPFFQTGDVKAAELYLHQHEATYNELGLAQSKLWQPGTLCITIAANIAESAILAIPGCFPDSVVGFVAEPEIADTRFIKYKLDTLKIAMQSASLGTTQDNLSLDKLLRFDFLVPSLPTQQRIAAILSAYDDLIENNTRRIAILEEMARRLYEEWFVHFRFPGHEVAEFDGDLPRGWEMATLTAIARVNPEAVKPSRAPQLIRYIDIASVSRGQIDAVHRLSFSEAPSRARRIVRDGDVIWSCVRPNRRSFALVLDPEEDTLASTGFAVLRADAVPFSYLYCATTTDAFVSYLTNHATGAAYPAVKQSDFERALFVRPSRPALEAFDRAAQPMLRICAALQRKNANLRAQRDLLLPKLVSGEIDVMAAETMLEAAE